MAIPNQQRFVNGKVIIVTLAPGQEAVFLTVGPVGSPSHPDKVSIKPFLSGGLNESQAILAVMDIAEIAVKAVTS